MTPHATKAPLLRALERMSTPSLRAFVRLAREFDEALLDLGDGDEDVGSRGIAG